MFVFAKSSKEPMVEEICSLEVVKCMIEKKVEVNAAYVVPLFDKVFDDDEKMKKDVFVENEKEIVLVNDDDDDADYDFDPNTFQNNHRISFSLLVF